MTTERATTERTLWDLTRARLGSVVLLVPNARTRHTTDRLATLTDVRIDTSDTDAYIAGRRYVRDPAYLERPGAFVIVTVRYLDTGKKIYDANPHYLRDPETRLRLIDTPARETTP